jgi:hypothetical protein
MQWLQDPSQSNLDNLKNVRREASRYFRYKKKEYLKVKFRNLKLVVKKYYGLVSGHHDLKKGY